MSKVVELETKDPKLKADEYLRKHHIVELFEVIIIFFIG